MHLFKDDTDVNLARVMSINGTLFFSTLIVKLTNKEFFLGWTSLKQQCLAMTPRRFGKTMAVGMFVVSKSRCFQIFIPNIRFTNYIQNT